MNQLIASRAVMGVVAESSWPTASQPSRTCSPGRTGQVHRVDRACLRHVFGHRAAVGRFHHRQLSWNWVFLMNVPAEFRCCGCLQDISPSCTRDRKTKAGLHGNGDPDTGGGLPVDRPFPWRCSPPVGSLQVGGLLGFGLAMAVIFLVIESRSDSPIMPLEIYRNRAVAVSVTVTVLTGLDCTARRCSRRCSSRECWAPPRPEAAALLTPMMLAMVFGAIVSGRRLSRVGGGYRRQALICSAAMAVGIYFISTMNENTSFAQAMAYVSLTGLGLGGTMSTCNLAVQNSVPFRLGRQRHFGRSVLQIVQRYAGSGSAGGHADGELLIQVGRNRLGVRQVRSCPGAVRGHQAKSAGACRSLVNRRTESRLRGERA